MVQPRTALAPCRNLALYTAMLGLTPSVSSLPEVVSAAVVISESFGVEQRKKPLQSINGHCLESLGYWCEVGGLLGASAPLIVNHTRLFVSRLPMLQNVILL